NMSGEVKVKLAKHKELLDFHQTRTIKEYIVDFQFILSHVEHLSEKQYMGYSTSRQGCKCLSSLDLFPLQSSTKSSTVPTSTQASIPLVPFLTNSPSPLVIISNSCPPSTQPPSSSSSRLGNVYPIYVEPKSVKQALQDPKWFATMNDEFSSLQRIGTWSLVRLPPNRFSIGCKWIFKIKENVDCSFNKYKARIIAKGFSQRHNFDLMKPFLQLSNLSLLSLPTRFSDTTMMRSEVPHFDNHMLLAPPLSVAKYTAFF
ncbi:putative mitochondrial protein, partial [Mucuna pruriens]